MEYYKGVNRDKRFLYINLLDNVSIFLILFYFYWRYGFYLIHLHKSIYLAGIISFAIIAIISQISVTLLYKENCKTKSKNDLLIQKVKNLEEINHTNKIQRHDLKNHLTVIQGLTVKNKFDTLKNYMSELVGEVQSFKFNIDTGIKEIDILIESKYYEAKKDEINLNCNVKDKLMDIKINPFDLVKIISNIIDNAIDELKDKNDNDREIIFEIEENLDDYAVSISDNGNKISDKILDSIFNKGVSTKSGPGRGYGLYIVNNTLKKAKVGIKVESDDRKTKFIINIPKAKVENLVNA